MISPFVGFNNAILKIPDGLGTFGVNPDTGNYEQVNTYINYKAILMIRNPVNFERTEGVDSTEQLIRGYLIDPMFFPPHFALPAIIDCEFTSTDSRISKGQLELEIVLDPFKVGEIAGQQLYGTFRVDGAGNESNS